MTELNFTSLKSDANLQAYYRFEGDSTDSSDNTNNGTDTAVSYSSAQSKWGQGAVFNGSSSIINVVNDASLRPATNFSINAWIKTSTDDTSIFQSWDSTTGADDNGFQLLVQDDHLFFRIFTGGAGTSVPTTVEGTSTITDGSLHMVTAIYDTANSRMRVWVDASLETTTGSISSSVTYVGTNVVAIGARKFTSGPTTDSFFNGGIDDLALLDKVLSQAEIDTLFLTGAGGAFLLNMI